MQERLNQVVKEKKKESRSGMEIMNLLQVMGCYSTILFENKVSFLIVFIYFEQKEGRQRGTWNGKKADNDFYKKIVWSL